MIGPKTQPDQIPDDGLTKLVVLIVNKDGKNCAQSHIPPWQSVHMPASEVE